MIELKKCPFCGSENVGFSQAFWNKWFIRCRTCGCRTDEMYESADYAVKEELAEKWNRRAE